MAGSSERAVQEAFRALADPSRRDILRQLSEREMTVGEVAAGFPVTRAAVRKHLDILTAANLVSARTVGRTRMTRLEPEGLRAVSDWIGYFERFWDARLTALQAAVAAETEKDMNERVTTKAKIAEPVIAKTIFFAAQPARVWPFLVEKDRLGQWLHRAEADLVEGEAFALLRGEGDAARRVCWGRVLEMAPPHRLRMTFSVNVLDGIETIVTIALEAVAGGTRLTLTHEGLGAAGDRALIQLMAFDAGWDEHFAQLRAALAAPADTNHKEGD